MKTTPDLDNVSIAQSTHQKFKKKTEKNQLQHSYQIELDENYSHNLAVM